MKQISPGTAVNVGILWVNIPILPIMFAPLFIFLFAVLPDQRHPSGDYVVPVVLGLFVIGFVLAWTWWSVMVPHWHLWAWQRVEDRDELKRKAVGAGIIWPEGWIFEKTELPSKRTQAKLRDLESGKSTRA